MQLKVLDTTVSFFIITLQYCPLILMHIHISVYHADSSLKISLSGIIKTLGQLNDDQAFSPFILMHILITLSC